MDENDDPETGSAPGDLDLPEFERAEHDIEAQQEDDHADKIAADLEPVFDVPVQISAVLGNARMDVASLLKLSKGSVLELDRKVGEAIDIYVNNRLVARGEVVVVDHRLGVTMTEIIKDGEATG